MLTIHRTTLNEMMSATPWLAREVQRYKLHKTVLDVLSNPATSEYVCDWVKVLSEWPHESLADASRLAFTETPAKGEADRQTITTVGRYIRRHCPDMPDSVLRALVSTSSPDSYEIVDTLDAFVAGVQDNTASSCMKYEPYEGHEADDPDDAPSDMPEAGHPYRVYNPSYGWRMCLKRNAKGVLVGRALLMHDEESGDKYFVRTYRRATEGTCTDDAMQDWLKAQGYTHKAAWHVGAKLSRITAGEGASGILMPFIDGQNKMVCDCGTHVEVLDAEGEAKTDGQRIIRASSTEGWVETNVFPCRDCGAHEVGGDMVEVVELGYRFTPERICHSCADVRVAGDFLEVDMETLQYASQIRGNRAIVHKHVRDVVIVWRAATKTQPRRTSVACARWSRLVILSDGSYALQSETRMDETGEIILDDAEREAKTDGQRIMKASWEV